MLVIENSIHPFESGSSESPAGGASPAITPLSLAVLPASSFSPPAMAHRASRAIFLKTDWIALAKVSVQCPLPRGLPPSSSPEASWQALCAPLCGEALLCPLEPRAHDSGPTCGPALCSHRFRSFSWGYWFLGLTKHLKSNTLSKIRRSASLSSTLPLPACLPHLSWASQAFVSWTNWCLKTSENLPSWTTLFNCILMYLWGRKWEYLFFGRAKP